MIKSGAASKRLQLRQKTDRQLLALVKRELKRTQVLAAVATTRESPFYRQAENILGWMAKLLPTISGLDRNEREALESAMKEVRLVLEQVPAEHVRVSTFSTIAS